MKPAEKTIEIQPKMYGLEAVYKACYAFLDRVYVKLEGEPEGVIRVRFRPKEGSKVSLEALAGEFENELLHQALRVKVADGNRKIREYIVTRALLSAQGVSAVPAQPAPQAAAPAPEKNGSVLDEELEKEIEKLLAEVEKAGAGGGDPLNITVPWEEKNGGHVAEKSPKTLKLEAVGPDVQETGGGCGSGCGCGSEGHGHGDSKKEAADGFEV